MVPRWRCLSSLKGLPAEAEAGAEVELIRRQPLEPREEGEVAAVLVSPPRLLVVEGEGEAVAQRLQVRPVPLQLVQREFQEEGEAVVEESLLPQ